MPSPGFIAFSADPNHRNRAAIVFVHGFTGDLKKTWRNIPSLLRLDNRLSDWDLVGFGYASSKLFDLPGLWSADADLTQIATMLYSRPELSASHYDRIAFVAHSMGGLVVQQAIVSHSDLRVRTSHVVLFGTPSNGLVKAGFVDFWKRRIDNMRAGSPFIDQLRASGKSLGIDQSNAFNIVAVAGERDQFIPPESSLSCFPDKVCRVIPGNHLTMLEGSIGHSIGSAESPAISKVSASASRS